MTSASVTPLDGEARNPRVALLDVDPDLGSHLEAEEAAAARRALLVPVTEVPRGQWAPDALLTAHPTAFTGVIVRGIVSRELAVGEQPTLCLLGPGDVILPLDLDAGLLNPSDRWSALEPLTIAILDNRFLRAAQYWPHLATALVERVAQQHNRALIQLSLAHQPRVEDRIALVFAVLAEQWGRMTAEGITLPIALTHEALGRLVGARRPTVSLALKSLRAEGRLRRLPNGAWLLPPDEHELPSPEPLPEGSSPRLVSIAESPGGNGSDGSRAAEFDPAVLRGRHQTLRLRSELVCRRAESTRAAALSAVSAAQRSRDRRLARSA